MRWTALVLSTKLAAGIYARGKQPPPVRPECGSVSRDNFWWGQIHPDRFNPDSAKKCSRFATLNSIVRSLTKGCA